MNETFGIGRVLATGFRVWGRNLVPFLAITTVVFLPFILWGISLTTGTLSLQKIQDFSRYGGLLQMLLSFIASAAVTYGVVMELQGQRASVGACIAVGLTRFFPVLGVALLSLIIIFAGVFLLIVGMVVFFCMLYVATPVAVIEKPGVMASLARSRSLTYGRRWHIFGLLFVLGLISGIVQAVITVAIKINSPHDFATFMYVTMAFSLLWGSIGSVMNAVTYYYLRQEKEGTSAAELAAVFE